MHWLEKVQDVVPGSSWSPIAVIVFRVIEEEGGEEEKGAVLMHTLALGGGDLLGAVAVPPGIRHVGQSVIGHLGMQTKTLPLQHLQPVPLILRQAPGQFF